VRLVVLTVALGACTFQPRAAGTDAPAGQTHDARIDAPVDAASVAIDAPPDACADDDGDGICNGADDWPCGAKPTAPQAIVVSSPGAATVATLSQIDVNGGQLVVAAPNAQVAVAFHYELDDTACPGNCIDQLEVGWVPGDRAGCVFDNGVSKTFGASGDASGTFAAPGVRGVYDMRVGVGQNYSCNYNGADTWYHGQPAASTTIAKVCVH
jgi:hypothetical protein